MTNQYTRPEKLDCENDIDSRVTYWENCYNCANCKLSDNLHEQNDVCRIDNHEIIMTEDEVCTIFLSDWTGKKLGEDV